ncbi:MAG: alpha/beta hydrolase [Halieaceae bacterium]
MALQKLTDLPTAAARWRAVWRYLRLFMLWTLVPILAVIGLWILWSLLAYRDIPVAELEQRYGAPQLAEVEIDGVPLRYRVDGEGPALLLIHSHYFNMRMWDDWVPLLAQHFQVIRFDMTSHGLTGPEPNGDYSMDRDLALILGLLDELGVDRFSIAGSSLGGNMAFHLAGRYPQRVERIALINSGGIPRPGSRGTSGTIPGWVDYVTYLVPTAAFRSFLEWMIIDDAIVTDALVTEFHQMFRRAGNRFAEFQRLRSFRVGDPTGVLAAIEAPVLLLWGGDNPQLPVTQVDKFLELLVNSEQVQRKIYPGVGHVIPLEIPQQGSRDLLIFLNGGEV